MSIIINEAGMVHLKESLAQLHKKYVKMDESHIGAFLLKIENSYRNGKGAIMEIKAHESTTGQSETILFSKDLYSAG